MSCYYVGLDVHKASICIAVLNAAGKLVIESIIETSAATILAFSPSVENGKPRTAVMSIATTTAADAVVMITHLRTPTAMDGLSSIAHATEHSTDNRRASVDSNHCFQRTVTS